MREELGSRFARTSSCRRLVQFLAKFDQKCLLTDSSLEMTLLLCATKSINSQNLHIIEKMLHSSYSVFDYLSESLRMERAFDQLPEGLTTLPKAQYCKYFDLFLKQNPLWSWNLEILTIFLFCMPVLQLYKVIMNSRLSCCMSFNTLYYLPKRASNIMSHFELLFS